jgi:hypothetical protein
MVFVELIETWSKLFRNVPVPQMFPDGASVLAFRQSVVIASSRSAFGLSYEEFIEEFGNGLVDELTPVIGMKVDDREKERG